ncbi:ARM repeat-containing protein [Microthyrium microscopicum]|uniref:Eukaryotic translation initiation factor 3 subunit K n=1 Tax=Microthyrium microscopicum TaxID=703497 RepID=A0A6A6UHP1_9PEZI|nr:ARM repeat-containing protein [Microthyrium microscopicum]
MGIPFDYAQDRPENIEAILNGLDRYNPETTKIFEEYVLHQCENKTYDCYANLALLKLYQFNPPLARDETITNILVKSLTVFPSPDFSLCLSLLPPHVLQKSTSTSHSNPAAGDAPLTEAVQKLNSLNNLLASGDYTSFWNTYDGDDLFADLVADVAGFEDMIRLRIILAVSQAWRDISLETLEEWLNVDGKDFEHLMGVVGFKVEGETVKVPLNKENEAKGTVIRENVKFDQFNRVIRRAFEQPA